MQRYIGQPNNTFLGYLGWSLAVLMVFLIVCRMVTEVLNGTQLPYTDYWTILDSLVTNDGNLKVTDLVFLVNGHPLVIPKIILWLNLHFFEGSNVSLGLFNIVIVCLQLVLIFLYLKLSAIDRPSRILVLLLSTALLFGMTGTWNFMHSVSGAAWLTTNLLVLAAIYCRARGSNLLALTLAIAATLSYSTGLAVWPAIIVVGLSAREWKASWKEWPWVAIFLFLAAIIAYFSPSTTLIGGFDLTVFADYTARYFGRPFTGNKTLAALLGCFPLIGIPLLSVWFLCFYRRVEDSVWLAIGVFGWCAQISIIMGRYHLLSLVDIDQDRYYSIAAMTWIGFFSLLLLVTKEIKKNRKDRSSQDQASIKTFALGHALYTIIIALLISATWASLTAGRPAVEQLHKELVLQDYRSLMLRMDIVDGTFAMVGLLPGNAFNSTHTVKALGHYPFSRSTMKCPELGKSVQITNSREIVGEIQKHDMQAPELPKVHYLSGTIPAAELPDQRAECIIVTNQAGIVVGVGKRASGPRNPDTFRLVALALPDHRHYTLSIVGPGEYFLRLHNSFEPHEVESGDSVPVR
ncbi:MAG: hypothetical protein HRT77_07665 [Halioglobus sp.]|nr:hypothetical protein [Halioglobus sp.]